jgi:ABC-type uncharacterized transport system substrate-binding protein
MLTVLLAVLCLIGRAATAHPHVWVSARSDIAYNPDGRVAGVRRTWTVDEAFSSFA